MTSKQLFKQIEQEIADDAPTKRADSRNALKKYLGKKVRYTCTFAENHGERNSCLIKDVKVLGKNKLLCDHLWLNNHYPFKKGDVLEFTGIATNYTDGKGNRTYRLAVFGKMEKI